MMAFNLIHSFACLRSPILAQKAPPKNHHFKPFFNPNTFFLSKTLSIRHNHAVHSLPPKHSNTETNADFSIETSSKVEILKSVLRELADPWESLNMIDAIQRLGLAYHFQEEIEVILQRHYATSFCCVSHENDIHKVALHFRLLRQQGYYVPVDVFKIFMDTEGNFDEDLRENINGVMSLYEASQLCMQGEEYILEEARRFTKGILYSLTTNQDHHQVRIVENTLAFPHYKSVSIFMAKNYFIDTQWTNKWISILRQVAKIDFNATQALRQKELVQFSQWWKESGLAEESYFARHRPVAWYTFSLTCFPDPNHSEQRILLAKVISFIYIIDDIYDVFGTLDELTLFTQAICRWDMSAAEKLPNCMKFCFEVLDETTKEIRDTVYRKYGYNPIESLRKEWGKLVKAFMVEAEGFRCEKMGSAEEYLKNGMISSGVPLALVHVFYLMGECINEENVEILDGYPDIVSSAATIFRLYDDMGNAQDEGQECHDGSYMEYYMKEHRDHSFDNTRKHVENLISDAWKALNTKCFLPNPFPQRILQVFLNIARMVPITFNYDNNGSQTLENLIKSVLFESADTRDIVE